MIAGRCDDLLPDDGEAPRIAACRQVNSECRSRVCVLALQRHHAEGAVSGLDGGFNLETTHFRSELANDDETVEVELTVSLTPRHLPTDAQPR
jgi:hypothetical protein